jgi:hypothetical protein
MTGFGVSKGGGQRPRALGQRPKAERLQVLLQILLQIQGMSAPNQ